jgi:hypothetical protein
MHLGTALKSLVKLLLVNILYQQIEQIIRSYGGARMGISTWETLIGGPPSADLTYILPEAKSAITFALPLNRKFIHPFLAKEDRLSHERDNLQVNILATGLAAHLAKHLEQKGFPSGKRFPFFVPAHRIVHNPFQKLSCQCRKQVSLCSTNAL